FAHLRQVVEEGLGREPQHAVGIVEGVERAGHRAIIAHGHNPGMSSIPVRDAHERIYEVLTGEDQGRVCRDIPEEACSEQPRNFLTHVASLAATKTADGLLDPKLVLAWLLGALGAPLFMVGLLVPVREAGALLPQLVIAAGIRSLPVRKWVWAAGSVVQGLCAAGIALAAATLEGAPAGWTILA